VANTYLKDEKRSVVHVVPPPASERKDRGDGT